MEEEEILVAVVVAVVPAGAVVAIREAAEVEETPAVEVVVGCRL